jgi:hypothetical protein
MPKLINLIRVMIYVALLLALLCFSGCFERFAQKKDPHAGESAEEHAAHSEGGHDEHAGETAEEHAAHSEAGHEGETAEEHAAHSEEGHEGHDHSEGDSGHEEAGK